MFNLKPLNSVAHFIAKVVKSIEKDAPKAVSAIEATKSTVETVSGAAAVATGHAVLAPAIIGFEDLGYALVGELGDVFINGTAAQQQHLLEAGLDVKVIDTLKLLVTGEKALVAAAKAIKL